MTAPRRGDTAWVLLLLAISGNPAMYALTGGQDNLLPFIALALAIAVAVSRAHIFHPRFVRVTAALVAIQLVQCYQFQFWPVVTILGMVTRLFVAAAIVALVEDFPAAYQRAITIVAVYCLVMWTLDQTSLALGIDFRGLFGPLERAIGMDAEHRFAGVYTFTVLEGTHRNAGFFREPGLFAGYLLLGLLWLMIDRSAGDPQIRRRRIAILLLALFTTFSTAGYVTLPLVLAAVAFQHRERIRRAVSRKTVFIAVFVVSLGGLWLVSENTTFLEDKVQQQYEEFLSESTNYEITRFGAALLDLNAIQERPLFGWGLHESTRFAQTPELAELAPSGGVTGWARSFGLIGVAVFLVAVAGSMRPRVGGRLAATIYVTAVIAVIAQPNTFLNYPTFLTLMLLPPPRATRSPDPAHPPAGPRSHPS